MNKTALKNFATNARKELIEKVKAKAFKIGITEENIKKAQFESSDAIYIDGKQLTATEKIQRGRLINRIKEIGYKQVVEEVAYTWFNRFTALRFMEVNDYLPTKVRVLSSLHADSAEPDMMKEALSLGLDLDNERIYELKMNNETDELFKYLIKMHCNYLNSYMPFMFETIEDYTEILFPEGLLGTGSFISQMTDTEVLPEENWVKIEVIGWLYQYYISEEKDRVFKERNKYKAEEIPFATQLFTPDWIVRYMVQNSLGRYWVEAHPEHGDLISGWEFYLVNEQEKFQKKIAPYVSKELNVEDIKCFDPAMGSGHILVYMFDVLYEIYIKCGYMEREIPRLIIEKNLYGLDIDDRAYQLASFSVVMKALEYNRRFLRSIERDGLMLNLASVQETNGWTVDDIKYIAGESIEQLDTMNAFFEQYRNAKAIGSLIKVTEHDTAYLESRLHVFESAPVEDLFEIEQRENTLSLLPKLIKQTNIMRQQYDILVTNPPYMGLGSMNKELSDYLKRNYPDSKSDLFAAFMEVDYYLKKNGFYASINQHSWMFLSSYEKLREKVIQNKFIENMLHLGPRAFEEIGGEIVQSTAFVLRNAKVSESKGTYLRMIEDRTAKDKKVKAMEAVQNSSVPYRYSFNQENFRKIPGSPIAYWVSDNIINTFSSKYKVEHFGKPRKGLVTMDNNRFLRLWYEVEFNKSSIFGENSEKSIESSAKWFPLSKGGGFRRWYGNRDYFINWFNNGKELKDSIVKKYNGGSYTKEIRSESFYFKPMLAWSGVSSGDISFRLNDKGFIFDTTGPAVFPEGNIYELLGFLNSSVVTILLKFISPTLSFLSGDISILPINEKVLNNSKISNIVIQNIKISKMEWDFYETSWDFGQHPLLIYKGKSSTIEISYKQFEMYTKQQFNLLKVNEEELNRIFIEIYGLQDELTPEVDAKDVSIRIANLERDIKSFISYAIGCSFGRYSLDEEGLIYAGGEFDPSRYKTFPADQDNILPVLPGAYFVDDIVTRFVDFTRMTFGEETLKENLDYISDAIGRRNAETTIDTVRRYFMNDFFKDHVQLYNKRPVYWLFTSGKQKAFNCLIYMHRYDKTTLSRIRIDYLHELQVRLDAEKKTLLSIIEGDGNTKEISNAKKELKSLDLKIEELRAYDEKLHHMADMQIEIDLDDGVAVNYAKFDGLLAPIK
ncbi:restriction endonuclease [Paenibacillus sp. Root52]|uniref:BREX-1 system adenine-specific DNA-methyltransferase PglX n=1 Tax=Paenibacillus sp. Root52 TaxID=1736552 RepID=UPI0006F4A789|nr:BREX-1 system adenine-specific DNA-methyltransferase PglX [Paenibacillus sp. Root52]KQY85279.1 restriction endonuclease [Paenibacillus sp. Root52]